MSYAFVITLVLAFAFEKPLESQIDASSVFSVVWLGVVGSGLAFLAFFFLLGRWGATRTALIAYLLPVVGVVLGVVVRNEQVSLPVLIGMGLIIGGVALANARYGHRRLWGRREPPKASAG